MADGSETIWGLKALDEFFEHEAPKDGKPGKPGVPVTRITTDTAREFAQKRFGRGREEWNGQRFTRATPSDVEHRPRRRKDSG